MISRKERIKCLIEGEKKEIEEFAKKYPKDIGRLYSSYKQMQSKKDKSKVHLHGYYAAICDLIIIKKGY